jgi:hypothetical protein
VRVTAHTRPPSHGQLYVNGIRVDTDVLSGTWTTFNLRTHYFTLDVTPLLTSGINSIGVMLGLGWRDTSVFPDRQFTSPCDETAPRAGMGRARRVCFCVCTICGDGGGGGGLGHRACPGAAHPSVCCLTSTPYVQSSLRCSTR